MLQLIDLLVVAVVVVFVFILIYRQWRQCRAYVSDTIGIFSGKSRKFPRKFCSIAVVTSIIWSDAHNI